MGIPSQTDLKAEIKRIRGEFRRSTLGIVGALEQDLEACLDQFFDMAHLGTTEALILMLVGVMPEPTVDKIISEISSIPGVPEALVKKAFSRLVEKREISISIDQQVTALPAYV